MSGTQLVWNKLVIHMKCMLVISITSITCVCPKMFLKVTRCFETFSTGFFWTPIRLLTSVSTYVSFTAIPCSKSFVAATDSATKWSITCMSTFVNLKLNIKTYWIMIIFRLYGNQNYNIHLWKFHSYCLLNSQNVITDIWDYWHNPILIKSFKLY